MKKIFLAALAATTLFASCAKEDANNVPEGEQTRMGLSFSFAGTDTRAIVDDNATSTEKLAKDITVFIFDASGAAVTPGNGETVTINSTNFTEANNVYTMKDAAKIATTTGARKIYVGMNLPTSMKNITNEADLKAEMAIVMANLTEATGMAMFSGEVKSVDLVLDELQNNVTVTVERMVAKVGATYGSGLTDGEKTVAGVAYKVSKVGVGQDGTKMYPVRRFDGTKLFTPAGDNKEVAPDKNTLKAIDANGTAAASLASAIYAGEKSSPLNVRGEVAYAVFQATFVPEEVATVEAGAIELTTYTGAAASMWVITSDEGLYFCEATSVSDVTTANAVMALCTNATKQYYDKGYCYYYIYLNKTRSPEKYELHRNDFIHLEVADIKGLGTPGKDDDGEQPKPPTEPELPVDNEPTNLFVNVTVSPWNYGIITGVVLE